MSSFLISDIPQNIKKSQLEQLCASPIYRNGIPAYVYRLTIVEIIQKMILKAILQHRSCAFRPLSLYIKKSNKYVKCSPPELAEALSPFKAKGYNIRVKKADGIYITVDSNTEVIEDLLDLNVNPCFLKIKSQRGVLYKRYPEVDSKLGSVEEDFAWAYLEYMVKLFNIKTIKLDGNRQFRNGYLKIDLLDDPDGKYYCVEKTKLQEGINYNLYIEDSDSSYFSPKISSGRNSLISIFRDLVENHLKSISHE